jgi:predicted signal transduction protein with EAL and GGDEF domain
VQVFTISGRRLDWSHVADLDLAGYRVRWCRGSVVDWGRMTPAHGGLLTSSPFLLDDLPAGPVTIAIKAVDDGGRESQAAAAIYTDLGDQPARFGDAEIQVGAAVGVALSPTNGIAGEELLRAADLALLSAKGHPGSHICLFTPELKLLSARNAGVDSRVRSALRAGNIDVAYQPLIDRESGRVVALEARP